MGIVRVTNIGLIVIFNIYVIITINVEYNINFSLSIYIPSNKPVINMKASVYVEIYINHSNILFFLVFFSFFFIFSPYNIFFKNWPVYDSLTLATSSGVPVATILPPISPPSGPKSII